jgi:hypothetical protein
MAHARFSELGDVLAARGLTRVDGVLLDFRGVVAAARRCTAWSEFSDGWAA